MSSLGVVGFEVFIDQTESFAVSSYFVPIPLDVDKIFRHVVDGTFEDLVVESGTHRFLERFVLVPSFDRVRLEVVGSFLGSAHLNRCENSSIR